MKKLALLLFGCMGLLPAFAVNPPRGSVMELHSCELYAGGCTVSSEAPQGGRYMLRVWNFSDGEFAEAKLAGLQMALLETSTDNLAVPDALPRQGVLYLPDSATSEQRSALRQWAKSAGLLPDTLSLEARIVPMRITSIQDGYEFSASPYISVKTASLESCAVGSCGEALWYKPRTDAAVFTVAVNQFSKVSEPLLKLNWQDGGKKSVFLARMAGEASPQDVFVSSADLCAPGSRLF